MLTNYSFDSELERRELMIKVLCDSCGKECINSDVYKLPRIIDTYATNKSGTVKIMRCKSIKIIDSNLCDDCKRKLSLILEKLPCINLIGYSDSENTLTFGI
jgi:predicted RNA-binding Zn-ribbon protein involved in translation (DUF1610 family)